MMEGFLLDQSQACRLVTKWIEGKPEISIFLGAKVNGRKQLEVQSFRCVDCSFLESYAPSF